MLLFSPAKLNLFLQIVRKRADGYHELVSFFQAISLGDWLHFSQVEGSELETIQIKGEGEQRLRAAPNLISEAFSLFRKKTGKRVYLSVELQKNIPLGAGLGGGSSNAATALFAINAIAGGDIDIKTLSSWGSELGSDIPFFFSLGSALCRGRGEQVAPCRAPPQPPSLHLFTPKIHLSTPSVYAALRLESLPERDSINCLSSMLKGCYAGCFNDLQQAAFFLEPQLHELYHQLNAISSLDKVLMTGSGSSFFAIGSRRDESSAFLADLNHRYMHRSIQFIGRKRVDAWYEASC